MADYEQANANYEKALLLDPRSVSVQLTLANIDLELGNFGQAFAQYQEALTASASPKDKLDVYNALEKYYVKQGQIKKSIEYMHLKMTEMEKFSRRCWCYFAE
ncbi:hypothetical protein IH970_09410 [candidate division KSB1 bacterium]|nr:hypothetical protein [candidate division KSB1 bacterium]